jgi:hypothetical protein
MKALADFHLPGIPRQRRIGRARDKAVKIGAASSASFSRMFVSRFGLRARACGTMMNGNAQNENLVPVWRWIK